MSANSDFGTFGRYKEFPLDKMTPDKKRICQLTMKERGRSNKEIATRLSVSEKPSKEMCTTLLSKLGVKDRTHAVVIGLQRGIIKF